jgi:hypothetical protein
MNCRAFQKMSKISDARIVEELPAIREPSWGLTPVAESASKFPRASARPFVDPGRQLAGLHRCAVLESVG